MVMPFLVGELLLIKSSAPIFSLLIGGSVGLLMFGLSGQLPRKELRRVNERRK